MMIKMRRTRLHRVEQPVLRVHRRERALQLQVGHLRAERGLSLVVRGLALALERVLLVLDVVDRDGYS